MAVTSPSVAVITGIGCVSPFGIGGHDFVAAVLRANQTAIRPMTGVVTPEGPRQLGAAVPEPYLPETEDTRRWSRLSRMTVTACRQALEDAGLHGAKTLPSFGLVVGTEFGDLRSTEAFARGFLRKGPLGLSPLLFPNTVMNAMAGTTSIALGLQGPMLTLNQQGAAGEVAIARAISLIRARRAPAVLACGVDELFPLLYDVLSALNIPSPRAKGEEACRPFDQRHNGPVLGEGATAVVVESYEHARARGVPILAAVYGVGWGSLPARVNRYPLPQHGHGRLLKDALEQAAIRPEEIGVAYLSGSGDPAHDTAELALLTAACRSSGPLVTSVTHLTGEYGGLGTFRVAAAIATLTQGVWPRLDYLSQPIRPDVAFATPGRSRPAPRAVLVHSLARGGTQVAIVLGAPQQDGSTRL